MLILSGGIMETTHFNTDKPFEGSYSLIFNIIKTGNSAADINDFLASLLDLIISTFSFTGGALYETDNTAAEARITVTRNVPQFFADFYRSIPCNKEPFSMIFKNNEALILTADNDLSARGILDASEIKSAVIIPLGKPGAVRWSLNLFSSDKTIYTDTDKESIGILSRTASLIIDNLDARAVIQSTSQRIKASEERLSLTLDAANEGIWDWNITTGETYYSSKFFTMLGYNPESLPQIHQTWIDLIHPEDRALVLSRLNEYLKNKRSAFDTEFRMKNANAGWTWIQKKGRILERNAQGEPLRMAGTHVDISQRKTMEDVLFDLGEKYQNVISNANESIIIIQDGLIKFCNRKTIELLGLSYDEIYSYTIEKIIYPDDYAAVTRRYAERLAGTVVKQKQPFRMLQQNGSIIWVEDNISSISWNNAPAILDFITDISERIKSEEALRESEERYRLLFMQTPMGIIHYNADLVITDLNSRFAEILRSTRERILHLDMHSLLDQRILPAIEAPLIGQRGKYEGEYIASTSSAIIDVSLQSAPLLSPEGTFRGAVCIIEDITERKHAEREILKTQKLESIGILAGGIAHDFNNILTGIIGSISLAKLKEPEDSEQYELLTLSEKAALRAKTLTQQLLTFAKGGSPIRETASIKEIIEESVQFTLRGSNVLSRFEYDDNLPSVFIDTGQISQVMQNISLNAVQAMTEGGILSVRVQHCSAEETSLLQLKQSPFIKIIIADTGKGIPKKELLKIFDPYFTTKDHGSGLGLAVVYSIIKNHEGHISVASVPGKGTTFSIYLPASDAILEKHDGLSKGIPGGCGKVLLIDDDDSVRVIGSAMLEKIGYQPITAASCEDGLIILKTAAEEDSPFSLVILDLTIPGKTGGKDAISLIRKIAPTIPAIVSSGYSNDPVMSDYTKFGFNGVLTKPYRIEELATEISRVLASA